MVLNLLLIELGHGGRRLRLQHAPPEIPRRGPSLLRPQRPAARGQEEKRDARRRSLEFPAKTESEKSDNECGGTLFRRLFRRRSPSGEEADDAEADVAAHRAVAGEGCLVRDYNGGGSIPVPHERFVTGQFGRQRQKLRYFVSEHGSERVTCHV